MQGETLETVMENYNFYVPNIYAPDVSVMDELIKVITMNGAVDLYPKMWDDLLMLEMHNKENVVARLLQGMVLNRVPPADSPSEITVKFGEIAYSIFLKSENDKDIGKHSFLELTNELLSDILTLCLCARNFENAQTIFKHMLTEANKLEGNPSPESLDMYLDKCIDTKDIKDAMQLMRYCHDNAFGDDKKLGRKLIKSINLSPAYKTHLIAILGKDILEDDSTEDKVAN